MLSASFTVDLWLLHKVHLWRHGNLLCNATIVLVAHQVFRAIGIRVGTLGNVFGRVHVQVLAQLRLIASSG